MPVWLKTRNPLVSGQRLYQWATVLPQKLVKKILFCCTIILLGENNNTEMFP